MKHRIWLALVAILALVMVACGSDDDAEETTTTTAPPATEAPTTEPETTTTEAPTEGTMQRDLRFIVVSHGQSSDPFWSVAANGVNDAADDMGVEVAYQAPGTFDMAEMASVIEAAVASQPDGLVVTIPDADILGDSIRSAVDAGIPVISMNSGSDDFADLGVLVHVGQTEFAAGLIAGQRMAAAGTTNAICINQEVGNTALDDRCNGFAEGLGGPVEVVPVDLGDPAGTQSTIGGAISADSSIDGILTLGPTAAVPAIAALDELGSLGSMNLATFDLGTDVLEAVRDGNMLFAIDQAQYLQGYLPIVLLTKFVETAALPLGSVDRVILTGPQIVTADTAADVIDYAAQGLR